MKEINDLIAGYRNFYDKYFANKKIDENFHQKQSPKTLVIACCDSRVDPAILTDSQPGDIFVVRNIANIVPPFEKTEESNHGTSAAIEFAVEHLHVKNIIILGHSACGGIKALMDGNFSNYEDFTFISSWMKVAMPAKEKALTSCENSCENKYATCEKAGIALSIKNLLTFPFVSEKVQAGKLKLHGWYFNLKDGKLYNLEEDSFKEI